MRLWAKSAHGISGESYCAPIVKLIEGRPRQRCVSGHFWLLCMITMLEAFAKLSPGIQMTDLPPRII